MRDYIVWTWWTTRQPVQASKGDAEVREHAGLGPKSNPAGWWGRAWTAVEVCRRGEPTHDAWMVRFEPWFRGLSRVSDHRPYSYIVEDSSECSPPERQFERAVAISAAIAEGRLASIEERRAVEDAGMKAAREWLRVKGFADDQISDTSATKPWDLEAERDGTKWYVEAKGSMSAWSDNPSVITTRNEVLHARENPDTTAMVIAASGKLSRGNDGRLLATPAKVLVISPWRPDDDSLTPLAYEYHPGALEAVLQRTWIPPNQQLEPTRQAAGQILSQRRAAHLRALGRDRIYSHP